MLRRTAVARAMRLAAGAAVVCGFCVAAQADTPTVIVAEGERFVAEGEGGWRVVHQDHSYASHAYGGMWVTFGGLLRAPAGATGAVAKQEVAIPETAAYRVWSKYQSPPYFNYVHEVQVWQGGRMRFSHRYGKVDAKRLYSFSGHPYLAEPMSQCWWPWGVDHDAAEAPREPVQLAAGKAEIRLIASRDAAPAGDRYVDFVLLTTEQGDTFEGKVKNGQSKSPFMFEAMHATPIWMRFLNASDAPAKVRLNTLFGHFTWHCGPKVAAFPEEMVPPGEWSPWFNVNRVVELVADEGVSVTLIHGIQGKGRRATVTAAPVRDVRIQVALGEGQTDVVADVVVPHVQQVVNRRVREGKTWVVKKVTSTRGEAVHFPLDFMWNRGNPTSRIRLSRDIAADIVARTKTWRKASPGKPKHIAFYGSFSRGDNAWALDLKDALGYNTLLPEPCETLAVDGYFQHVRSHDAIRKHAESLGEAKSRHRVASFGDEIHLGSIKFGDPQYTPMFRDWLKAKGITQADLGGVSPEEAVFNANPRLSWYSKLFSAEQRFGHYRSMTELAKECYGPQVETGANYSPHHGVAYYGHNLQWIDAFKHRAMTMFWSEDYIFSMGEPPQIFSFLFARAHCATKYHGQPIHMYVMPHAPAQPPEYFRRNMIYAIGAGAKHIDNFWVAPQENYSENYVSWRYTDTFRAIFESIHDTAAVEPFLIGAKRRPARVALVTGKATDINETLAKVDPSSDQFASRCENAPQKLEQTLCRKDHQAVYLGLRHAQLRVDLITEDDIIEGMLKGYDVVYYGGEWVNNRAIPNLDDWVRAGGTLVASGGLGVYNQYGEKDRAMLDLLGIEAVGTQKNLYHPRPFLELPLARPVGQLVMPDGAMVDAVGMKQVIEPADATVMAKWHPGTVAVTERRHGKGKAIAIGTLPGLTYLKTGLRTVPFARGGYTNLYNPTDFVAPATGLVRLGIRDAGLKPQVTCSNPHVEALVLDNDHGTLVTLVNWTNEPKVELTVRVRMSGGTRDPAVKSIEAGRQLSAQLDGDVLVFSTTVTEADFITIRSK